MKVNLFEDGNGDKTQEKWNREGIESLPNWLMGIEGDVDSCLYEMHLLTGRHKKIKEFNR